MTAAAEGNGRLEVRVDGSVRDLVADAVGVLAAVIEESLGQAAPGDRIDRRLADARRLSEELAGGVGSIDVAAHEDLVVDMVRATASQAAYRLDALLEVVAGTRAPLADEAVAELRVTAEAAAEAVDTLIGCEANRRAT